MDQAGALSRFFASKKTLIFVNHIFFIAKKTLKTAKNYKSQKNLLPNNKNNL